MLQQAENNVSRDQKKQLQKLQKQFSVTEEELNNLNGQKKLLEEALSNADNYSNKTKFLKIESDYNTIQKNIKNLSVQYEELFEKIMQMSD